MIRVLFPFVGDTLGGSNVSALLLIQNLDRSRYEPLLLLHEDGPFAQHLRSVNVPFEILTVPGYLLRKHSPLKNIRLLAVLTWSLTRFLRHRGIQIIHTNDSRMHMSWIIPGRLAGCRLIRHQRTVPRLDGWIGGTIGRLADRILCISAFVRASLPVKLQKRSVLIENPFEDPEQMVDRRKSRVRLEQELGVGAETRIIGFFSNLLHRKRPMLFLETAAQMLAKSSVPLSFAVFGEEREVSYADLRARAHELGIADRLHIMGFRHPAEPWLAACDLVLCPAVDEPFGRVLVEAMLARTPIVATDSGGHREIIENNKTGLLVAVNDPRALAEASLCILEKQALRDAIVTNARIDAISRFGVSAHVRRVSREYELLVTR